jgi:parallel beta-helix repeat protein
MLGCTALYAFLVTAPAAAGAVTTLYVGGAACSDSGQGTLDQPYCTISKAASRVAPGQAVQVADGTYPESVTLKISGTATAPIVFAAVPGATPTLTGSTHGFYLSSVGYVTVSGFTINHTSSSGIYASNSNHVTISGNHVGYSGLPIQGATAAGIQIASTTDSLVSGNTVDHNTVAGIYLTGSTTRVTVDENQSSWNAFGYVRNAPGIDVRTSGNTITRNISHDNEDSGLQFYPGANNNLVAGNVSYHNKGFTSVQLTNCNHPKTGDTHGCITGDHGIDDLNVTGNRIIGNSIYDNVSAGINVEGTSGDFTIANNVSVDNAINCPDGAGGTESCPRTQGNIRVDQNSTGGTTLHQDLVYLHLAPGQKGTMMTWKTNGYPTLAAFQNASGQEQNGLQADPLWLSPDTGDMHLGAGSPAIDSDDSAVDGELAQDIDGTARVDDPATPNTGTGPRDYDDRGAYEFNAGNATVPAAPTATATGALGGVELSWTTPSTGGSPITGYNVYRSTTAGGEGATPIAQVGAVNGYADDNLTTGATYYYQVSAINNVGEGARSSEVNAVPTAPTKPAAPVVSATAGTSSIQLTWTAPDDGGSPITGYNVYRSTSPGNEGSSPYVQLGVATSFTDTGLASGTTYYYEVSAANAAGEGALSAEVSATPVSVLPPSAPVVTASAGTSSVQLSWTTPASGGSPITGYNVYRSTAPGGEGGTPFVQLGVTTAYTDSGVTSGTTYYYQVGATNAVGESALSSEVNATPVLLTNLVANAGFETNTSGWVAGSGASLTLSNTAHTGSHAAALTLTTAGNDTVLNDSPNWNQSTKAATTCTASAWVQGPAGSKVLVRLREYQGSVAAGYTAATFTLQGATWIQVTVSAPVTNGGDTMDLNIYGKSFAAGQTLLVDDVSEVCQ